MKTLVAGLALALLVLATPAIAQPSPQGVTLEVTSAGTVPYQGSGSFAYSANIGCAELAAAAPSPEVVVTITDAPAWLNFTDGAADISPTGCLNQAGRVDVSGTVAFTVSTAAPAVIQHVVHLVASVGSTESEPASATLQVAYNSSYSVVPTAQFPLTVNATTTQFTVMGTQSSNAPSMIMVDEFSACDGALVSGFGALQYLNDGGKPDTKTYNIVFTAPTGDWESCIITLRVYGHYNFPDGSAAGEATDHKTITWEVVNGGVPGAPKGGGGNKAPAPVAMVTALGLLGFAALRRRRDD